ncbi:MAG: hypothetical protein QXD48_02530 [Candidatus Aenigmatarchaeota archaeon]
MPSILSYAIVVGIIVISTILVLNIINPILEEARMAQVYTESLNTMKFIDSQIRSIIFEAPGTRRTLDLNLREGSFTVVGGEDEIKITLEDVKFFSPGKTKEGNIVVKSGAWMDASEIDIDNDGTMDLVLENNAVLFAVKKLGSQSNHVFINTTNFITMIRNKRADVNITPLTAIYIDDQLNTSYGYGYTELTRIGKNIPSSGIRLWLNSSGNITYETLFTLDTISDFVTLEIRHIT